MPRASGEPDPISTGSPAPIPAEPNECDVVLRTNRVHGTLTVNGVDISGLTRKVTVTCEAGEATTVTVEFIGAKIAADDLRAKLNLVEAEPPIRDNHEDVTSLDKAAQQWIVRKGEESAQ